MKLYEISEEYSHLMSIDDDGEVGFAEAMNEALSEIAQDFEEKAREIVAYRRNLEAEAEAIDTEIKRLSGRKKSLQDKACSITDYLRHHMAATGLKKIDTGLFTISLVPGRPMVEIISDAALPDQYIKVERKPIKAEILKALKDGAEIPGAELGTSKPSVRIK